MDYYTVDADGGDMLTLSAAMGAAEEGRSRRRSSTTAPSETTSQTDGGGEGDAFSGLLGNDDRSDYYAIELEPGGSDSFHATTVQAGPLPFSLEVGPDAGGNLSARIFVGGTEVKRLSAGPGGAEAEAAEIEAAGPVNVEVWGQGGAYTVTLGTPPEDGVDTE